MKRELNSKEKDMIRKNIVFIKENLEYDNAIAKQVDVQIEIAPILYNHQVTEIKRKQEGLKAEIEEMQNSLIILEDQLINGVEIKEVKEEQK